MGDNISAVQIEHVDANYTKGGMINWNEFCMYTTTEIWGSNDPTKIPEKLEQLINYANEGMKDRLITELGNLYQSYYNAIQLNNWELFSYSALVTKINGQDVQFMPVEQKSKIICDLMTINEIKQNTSSIKKKLKGILNFFSRQKKQV